MSKQVTLVKSVCHMCEIKCGMDVYVGQAVALEDTIYIVGRFGQVFGTPNVTSSAAN